MKACDLLKPFKRQFIIIKNAIKIVMVMSFEGSFYPPLYIFKHQKIKVIIFQYLNFYQV